MYPCIHGSKLTRHRPGPDCRIKIHGAIFTNITHDHLDYHKTFENYIKAKKKYFDELGSDAFALVNADDKRGMVMMQNTKATKYSFGLKKDG